MAEQYWDPDIGTASQERLREIQTEKVKALVARAYHNTAFYRRRFDQAGIKPEDICTLDDFSRIPPTSYFDDFIPTPTAEKLAVPMSEVACVLSTSGTISGSPQPLMLSRSDLETWSGLMAQLLTMQGVREGDAVQSVFPAPCMVDRAVNLCGATMVPAGAGSFAMDYTIKLMQNLRPTVLLSSPSLFMEFERRALELGLDLKTSGLRTCIMIGESWSDAFRRRVESDRPTRFYDIYGLMEVGMIVGECQEKKGMHCLDHLFLLEIVDPETGRPVGPGEAGEIVATALWREAMPLLRYRTGDIAVRLPYERCACGRTFSKTSRVKGRMAQMITVGDVRVFPSDVEEVIHAVPELTGEYQIVVREAGVQQALEVRAEYGEGAGDLDALGSGLQRAFEERTGAKSRFELVPRGTMTPGIRVKAQRIVNA